MRPGVLLVLLVLPMEAAPVSGAVSNSATGAPVRKAQVSLRTTGAAFEAVTDATGAFRFAEVPPGKYTISATCQGFAPVHVRGLAITVGPEPVTDVAVRLLPLGVIWGRVIDEDGDPIAGAAVTAWQYDYTRVTPFLRSRSTALTDDRGQYRLFDLRPGRYYLQAAPSVRSLSGLIPPGMNLDAHPTVYYPGVADASEASAVMVRAGGEVGQIEFSLRPTPRFAIRGTATGEGRPLRGVVMAQDCTSRAPSYSRTVRPDGTFELPGVQPGRYCLSIGESREAQQLFAFGTVSVTDRDVEGVVLAGSPGVAIQGRVAMEGSAPDPPMRVRVTLEAAARFDTSNTRFTGKDGAFVFESVTPEPQILSVDGLPGEAYVSEIRYGNEDVTNGRLVPRPGVPLHIRLERNAGAAQVTVEGAGGSVAIVPVGRLAERRDLYRGVTVDEEALFASLPPGDYQAFAWEGLDPALVHVPEFRQMLASRATAFTVAKGATGRVRVKAVPAAEVEVLWSRLP